MRLYASRAAHEKPAVGLTDAEQPLLEKDSSSAASLPQDPQTVRMLLRFSAADSVLLLFAFAAGAQHFWIG